MNKFLILVSLIVAFVAYRFHTLQSAHIFTYEEKPVSVSTQSNGRTTLSRYDASLGPYYSIDSIWDEKELDALTDLVHNIKTFKSVVADQTSSIEHIGEAVPVLPNGACPHQYLILNKNRTLCILATRLDVGQHYVKTGGLGAYKEPFNRILSRTLSFARFFIDGKADDDQLKLLPELDSLFKSSSYLDASKHVCEGNEYLDPFQLGIIVQISGGQQLAVHYDVPWFWGANRLLFPQWLLVVMQSSGLYQSLRVPQIQGVAYIHKWDHDQNQDELEVHRNYHKAGFFFYPNADSNHNKTSSFFSSPKQAKVFPSLRNTAIMLDGSVVPHGTQPFRPSEEDKFKPLFNSLGRTNQSELIYNEENGKWDLVVDKTYIGSVDSKDLRFSLVWRAMCFKNKEQRDLYHSDDHKKLELNDVLNTLITDLISKGRLASSTTIDSIPPLDLAILLLNEYVEYPLPPAIIPYNYCVIPGQVGDIVRKIAC